MKKLCLNLRITKLAKIETAVLCILLYRVYSLAGKTWFITRIPKWRKPYLGTIPSSTCRRRIPSLGKIVILCLARYKGISFLRFAGILTVRSHKKTFSRLNDAMKHKKKPFSQQEMSMLMIHGKTYPVGNPAQQTIMDAEWQAFPYAVQFPNVSDWDSDLIWSWQFVFLC